MHPYRLIFLICIAVSTASAGQISDTITFKGSGILPSAGSFTYDTTSQSFTAFTVTWDSAIFNLTASANAPSLNGTECGSSTAATTFTFLTTGNVCGAGATGKWLGLPPEGGGPSFEFDDFSADQSSFLSVSALPSQGHIPNPDFGTGTFTVQSAAIPEPSSILLAMAGIAVLASKRRFPVR